MNLTPSTMRLAAAALAVIPMLMLMGVRMVGVQSPQSASAKSTKQKATAAPTAYVRRPLTAEQAAASAFAASQPTDAPLLSPFLFDDPGKPAPVNEIVLPPVASKPETARPLAEKPPAVVLTALMLGGREPLAVINGKPYRLGAEIAPGWALTSIDRQAASVTVTCVVDPEKTVVARLQRP
ncbi:MAG: hypothetical protein DYG93_04220 [Leptolyngbya sp. PLA2]|nr:hypothetical protein [Leptolyngbya sp.]MCE7970855.1 hypothetical protein [Leptolyngbya sp. PL-A2]MCQ3940330.1 hypothetical protein [cyanobacterium CYA1]MCZ7633695.1 hypothetical protein [Phycisphaerales bacterium]MDL1904600.1 hypothetical protein [Synechococcales cyanobacterium CNB]GIK17869.1 MAG: hypothetical protein BroJett004_00330 [Planctomycetota bacterium]